MIDNISDTSNSIGQCGGEVSQIEDIVNVIDDNVPTPNAAQAKVRSGDCCLNRKLQKLSQL